MAEFGEADVLIRAENDAETIERALRYPRRLLPGGAAARAGGARAYFQVAIHDAGSELVTAGASPRGGALPARGPEIAAIPIVTWKLLETCDRRRKHENSTPGVGCGGPREGDAQEE